MGSINADELFKHPIGVPKRITRAAAAEILDVSIRTMEEWHKKGFGPKAVKHGVRGVRYIEHEVIAFSNERVGM